MLMYPNLMRKDSCAIYFYIFFYLNYSLRGLNFGHFRGISLYNTQNAVAVSICDLTFFPSVHFKVITLEQTKKIGKLELKVRKQNEIVVAEKFFKVFCKEMYVAVVQTTATFQ